MGYPLFIVGLKQNKSTCPYYWYEQPYLEYLRSNHPELLNPASAAEVESAAEIVAEEVNGDLNLQMYQLKLELNEMKGKLGEVMLEIQETKKEMKETKNEIKEEIAKGNKPWH